MEYKTGSPVVLIGLNSDDLNSKKGEINGVPQIIDGIERYPVKLEIQKKNILIKEENIFCIPESEKTLEIMSQLLEGHTPDISPLAELGNFFSKMTDNKDGRFNSYLDIFDKIMKDGHNLLEVILLNYKEFEESTIIGFINAASLYKGYGIINHKDPDGNTPIHQLASLSTNEDADQQKIDGIIDHILKKGSSRYLKNNDGKNAFEICEKKKLKVEEKKPGQITHLHQASRENTTNRYSVVVYGMDVKCLPQDNNTPYMITDLASYGMPHLGILGRSFQKTTINIVTNVFKQLFPKANPEILCLGHIDSYKTEPITQAEYSTEEGEYTYPRLEELNKKKYPSAIVLCGEFDALKQYTTFLRECTEDQAMRITARYKELNMDREAFLSEYQNHYHRHMQVDKKEIMERMQKLVDEGLCSFEQAQHIETYLYDPTGSMSRRLYNASALRIRYPNIIFMLGGDYNHITGNKIETRSFLDGLIDGVEHPFQIEHKIGPLEQLEEMANCIKTEYIIVKLDISCMQKGVWVVENKKDKVKELKNKINPEIVVNLTDIVIVEAYISTPKNGVEHTEKHYCVSIIDENKNRVLTKFIAGWDKPAKAHIELSPKPYEINNMLLSQLMTRESVTEGQHNRFVHAADVIVPKSAPQMSQQELEEYIERKTEQEGNGYLKRRKIIDNLGQEFKNIAIGFLCYEIDFLCVKPNDIRIISALKLLGILQFKDCRLSLLNSSIINMIASFFEPPAAPGEKRSQTISKMTDLYYRANGTGKFADTSDIIKTLRHHHKSST